MILPEGAGPAWLAAQSAAFACPSGAIDEPFFRYLAVEHARHITDRFIERHASTIAAASDGVVPVLERWADAIRSVDAALEPAFGDAVRCAGASPAERKHAKITAASLALHLSSCGVDGDWEIALDAPLHLRCGFLLLPSADRISVRSDRKLVTVTMRSAFGHRVCTLPLSGDAAQTSAAASYATHLPRLSVSGASIRFLTRSALESSELAPDSNAGNAALASIDPDQIDFVKAALDFIGTYAPAYRPWVTRIVRDAILLDAGESPIERGSVDHYLGLVCLTACPDTVGLASLLVREAVRQHFTLLRRVAASGDASDSRVLTYHASANMLLFYRECLANGAVHASVVRERAAQLVPDLVEYEGALRHNASLSPVGSELVRTLAGRLALHEAVS